MVRPIVFEFTYGYVFTGSSNNILGSVSVCEQYIILYSQNIAIVSHSRIFLVFKSRIVKCRVPMALSIFRRQL